MGNARDALAVAEAADFAPSFGVIAASAEDRQSLSLSAQRARGALRR